MKNTQQLNAVLCIFNIVSSFLYSFPPGASELEKNMQEMKRNLSALREYSVGAFFLSFGLMGEVQKLADVYFMHSMYTRLRISNIL